MQASGGFAKQCGGAFWNSAWLALAAVWLALANSSNVHAQSPPVPAATKIFTARTAFKLPVKLDDKERAKLGAIRLYVKNSPTSQWVCHENGSAAQKEFLYRVSEDGEYGFTIVVVEQSGRQIPADVTREEPELVVVVDTKQPECDVHLATAPDDEIVLLCQVRDAHPDPSKTRLEYQNTFGIWQGIERHPKHPGCYRITNPGILQSKLRIIAGDRAGNIVSQVVHASGLKIIPPTDSGALLEALRTNGRTTANTASAAPAARDLAAPQQTLPNPEELRPNTVPPGPMMPAIVPSAAPAPTEAAAVVQTDFKPSVTPPPVSDTMSHFLLVNRRRVSMNYALENTVEHGAGNVEVWITADKGDRWQRIVEDVDGVSPVEFELPGEGVYGVSLLVGPGKGQFAAPPARGEAPDCWVEVDCTKPEAQVQAVLPANKDDTTCTITWKAADKNLKNDGIDLYFASAKGGPWRSIGKGLQNTGSYRWSVPRNVCGDIFLRMDVLDQAGNVTQCQIPQVIAVAAPRPSVRILGLNNKSE